VKADVFSMDSFSAHGDQREMLDVLLNQKNAAKDIYLVHGEHERQTIFRDYLSAEGFRNIHIPKLGQEVIA
jgi:metallo-beta-lactamase family protein